MKLYPGTPNIRLANPYTIAAGCTRLEAHEYGGAVSVSIVPCRVLGQRGLMLRADANNDGTGRHPPTVLETASDVKLRSRLKPQGGHPGGRPRHDLYPQWRYRNAGRY